MLTNALGHLLINFKKKTIDKINLQCIQFDEYTIFKINFYFKLLNILRIC